MARNSQTNRGSGSRSGAATLASEHASEHAHVHAEPGRVIEGEDESLLGEDELDFDAELEDAARLDGEGGYSLGRRYPRAPSKSPA